MMTETRKSPDESLVSQTTLYRAAIFARQYRILVAYVISSYGFWILGLPFWWKSLMGLNGLESFLWMVVFVGSPLFVPFGIALQIGIELHFADGNVLSTNVLSTIVALLGLVGVSFLIALRLVNVCVRRIMEEDSQR